MNVSSQELEEIVVGAGGSDLIITRKDYYSNEFTSSTMSCILGCAIL